MANRPVHAPNYSPETLVYIDWVRPLPAEAWGASSSPASIAVQHASWADQATLLLSRPLQLPHSDVVVRSTPPRRPTCPSDHQYNKWVPGWLYAGLSLLCISLGAYNFADRAIARWYTSKYHSLHRPPSGLSRGHAGKRKLEWLPSAILARWRTMSYRKNKVAGWFGLGSASQAVVIFAYLLLNLLIVLLGGAEPSVLIMPNSQLTALSSRRCHGLSRYAAAGGWRATRTMSAGEADAPRSQLTIVGDSSTPIYLCSLSWLQKSWDGSGGL